MAWAESGRHLNRNWAPESLACRRTGKTLDIQRCGSWLLGILDCQGCHLHDGSRWHDRRSERIRDRGTNAESGAKIWQTNVGHYLDNGWGGGPRSTPTISGDLLVAIGGKGDVVCLSVQDGAEKWRTSLTELGGTIPSWGYCESALIDGDRVFVTPGGSNGTIACFNLQTGEKIWQSSEMQQPANYSSIIAVDHFGKRQYIQLTGQKVFGLNSDGKLLWQHDFPGHVAVVATPIYKDGQVYVTAGYGAGCLMLNITANNVAEKIYDNKVMKNHHGGVLLSGDFLYGHSDDNGIICQNLNTGELVWSDKQRNGSKARWRLLTACFIAFPKTAVSVIWSKPLKRNTRQEVVSGWSLKRLNEILKAASGHIL